MKLLLISTGRRCHRGGENNQRLKLNIIRNMVNERRRYQKMCFVQDKRGMKWKRGKTDQRHQKGGNEKKYRTKKLYLVLYLWFISQKMPRLKQNVRTETNNQPETSADKGEGEETASCENTKPKVSYDFIPKNSNVVTQRPTSTKLTALLLKYMSHEWSTTSTWGFRRKVSLWYKKKLHVDERWKLDGITGECLQPNQERAMCPEFIRLSVPSGM